jgi:hypothetical protein
LDIVAKVEKYKLAYKPIVKKIQITRGNTK